MPAWTGGDGVLTTWQPRIRWCGGPKPPPQEANLQGTVALPEQSYSAVRLLVATRAAGSLLWGPHASTLDQVHLIDARKASTPPVRAVSNREWAQPT